MICSSRSRLGHVEGPLNASSRTTIQPPVIAAVSGDAAQFPSPGCRGAGCAAAETVIAEFPFGSASTCSFVKVLPRLYLALHQCSALPRTRSRR